jgi:SNF2 family DNA or RNA helicase
MLDLIEKAMDQEGLWYQRLDGTKSLSQRDKSLKDFRSNPACEVLLASLGAGGVGYVSKLLDVQGSPGHG